MDVFLFCFTDFLCITFSLYLIAEKPFYAALQTCSEKTLAKSWRYAIHWFLYFLQDSRFSRELNLECVVNHGPPSCRWFLGSSVGCCFPSDLLDRSVSHHIALYGYAPPCFTVPQTHKCLLWCICVNRESFQRRPSPLLFYVPFSMHNSTV